MGAVLCVVQSARADGPAEVEGIPFVRNAMRDPSQYPSAVLLAWMLVLAVEVILIAGAMYAFGQTVESPVLMSLPAGPVRTVCLLLVTCNCLCLMPFVCGPIVKGLDRKLLGPVRQEQLRFRIPIRAAVLGA